MNLFHYFCALQTVDADGSLRCEPIVDSISCHQEKERISYEYANNVTSFQAAQQETREIKGHESWLFVRREKCSSTSDFVDCVKVGSLLSEI